MPLNQMSRGVICFSFIYRYIVIYPEKKVLESYLKYFPMFLYLNNLAMVSYVCHCGVWVSVPWRHTSIRKLIFQSFIHNFKQLKTYHTVVI